MYVITYILLNTIGIIHSRPTPVLKRYRGTTAVNGTNVKCKHTGIEIEQNLVEGSSQR